MEIFPSPHTAKLMDDGWLFFFGKAAALGVYQAEVDDQVPLAAGSHVWSVHMIYSQLFRDLAGPLIEVW